MGLVQYYKGTRIRKARSVRLKGRPLWQDEVPETKQGKDTYRIAANNERSFSRIFLESVRSLFTSEIERRVYTQLKNQSVAGVISVLPGSNLDDSSWDKFNDSMFRIYEKIIQESGEAETKNINKKFGSNLIFTILKQKEIPVIPMNPYSSQWIRMRLREFKLQSISDAQKEVVMQILGDAFDSGLRPELIIDQIKQNIGLTNRQYKALQRRRELHEAAGLPESKIDELIEKYKDKLLTSRARMIARTETIAAQAAGRHTSWQLADEAGVLPETERVWDSAPESANPNRPCKICLDLDGKTAPINGIYESSYLGDVVGPPAHPSCRCTETLRRKVT